MFLTVCLNPTLQKTILLGKLIPGEVNRATTQRLDASGKGINVSRVLSQLDAEVLHLTQCGGWNGAHFLELAKADDLRLETVDSGVEVRFCHTVLDEVNGTVTEIVEEGPAPQHGTEEEIRNKFEFILGKAHTLIISGTKSAGFSDDVFPWMVSIAKARKLRVVIDIRGKDLIDSLRFMPDIVKPNVSEFVDTFFPEENLMESGLDERLVEKIEKKMLEIHKEYKSLVICTHGKHGAFVAAGGKIFRVDVIPVKAVNTVGCGDAFTAGLTYSLQTGNPLQEAIDEGMRCASLNSLEIRPGWIPG